MLIVQINSAMFCDEDVTLVESTENRDETGKINGHIVAINQPSPLDGKVRASYWALPIDNRGGVPFADQDAAAEYLDGADPETL